MAFGKSMTMKRLPTTKDILNCITDLQIFEYYLGGIPRKAISSPLREDMDPSFSLFHSKEYDKILFKDFATGEVGDAFVFVMKLFRLSRRVDAINKVARDFHLDQFDLDRNTSSYVPLPKKSYVKENNKKSTVKSDRLKISVTLRAWKIRDKEYWQDKYGLNKKQLEYCNIFPISHFFVNGYCTVAQDLAYAFVEEKDGVQTFKIYQPLADKDNKWTNNNDFSTWELWTQLPKTGNICIVTSSRKDAAVIKSLFPSEFITSCSLQSEGVNPKEGVVEELRKRFKEVFVMYDNDFDSSKNRGRIAGAKLADQTGFLQIEVPDGCGIKDPSDYRSEFGEENLRNLILKLIKTRLREEELKQII